MSYNGQMRKEKALFFIGLFILILPFLGFPNSWKTVMYMIIGIIIMYLAYLFYVEVKDRLAKNSIETKTFIDNISDEK